MIKDNKTLDIRFYVAECIEFQGLGNVYKDINSIIEAVNVYNKLPSTTKNLCHGIGAEIPDPIDNISGDYILLTNGIIADLDCYSNDIKEILKDAKNYLMNEFGKKQTESMENETNSICRPARIHNRNR